MNPTHSEEREDDSCNPVALQFAASKLEVYQHERLAYTDIPARNRKLAQPAKHLARKLLGSVSHWIRTHL